MSEAKQKEHVENKEKLICCRCNKELVPTQTFFDYLGHNFHTDILRCPECGEVYIPESLVKAGRRYVSICNV